MTAARRALHNEAIAWTMLAIAPDDQQARASSRKDRAYGTPCSDMARAAALLPEQTFREGTRLQRWIGAVSSGARERRSHTVPRTTPLGPITAEAVEKVACSSAASFKWLRERLKRPFPGLWASWPVNRRLAGAEGFLQPRPCTARTPYSPSPIMGASPGAAASGLVRGRATNPRRAREHYLAVVNTLGLIPVGGSDGH